MSLVDPFFIITHLDGRTLALEIEQGGGTGGLIQPGEVRVIRGEGMPHKSTNFSFIFFLLFVKYFLF